MIIVQEKDVFSCHYLVIFFKDEGRSLDEENRIAKGHKNSSQTMLKKQTYCLDSATWI